MQDTNPWSNGLLGRNRTCRLEVAQQVLQHFQNLIKRDDPHPVGVLSIQLERPALILVCGHHADDENTINLIVRDFVFPMPIVVGLMQWKFASEMIPLIKNLRHAA